MKNQPAKSSLNPNSMSSVSTTSSNMQLAYRIQLNRDFPFSEAEKYLPYLKSLGVSHVYLSPILKAVSGSNHCYDVTDFGEVNPELGGEDAFRNFCNACYSLGLGILLDIVPNHMAYSLENPYVEAALIDGTHEFRRIFDTFRNPFSPGDAVVFPFLPQSLSFLVNQHRVSITPGPIPVLHVDSMDIPLVKMPDVMADMVPKQGPGEEWADNNGALPDIEISSICLMEEILRNIPLTPVYWQYSAKRINYRRFFAVNGLIAIRSQDKDVIELTHRKILDLSSSPCVTGIRIDHLDGLYDPSGYVEFLRRSLPGKVILAEKVLIPGEIIPESLDLDGTTGYDFLGMINALYADRKGYNALADGFRSRAPVYGDVDEILLSYKHSFIAEEFSGDVDNLSWPIYDSLVLKHGYEFSYSEIRGAVTGILTSFEKYRTYSTPGNTVEIAKQLLNVAAGRDDSIPYILSDHVSRGCVHCSEPVLRFQQYSGALMAKNLEDRLFFSFNPMIFMNEVGWSPMAEIPEWHEFLGFIRKRMKFPFSLNEGSTHDTKFGEDLRNSGLVISEYADLFFRILGDLESSEGTRAIAGVMAVEHIYYITQLILASHGSAVHYRDYSMEIKSQITKAMRESMIRTSWKNPDVDYENAALKFAEIIISLLDSGKWVDGSEMANKCRDLGHYNSISMLVLRFMLPGVPALYQGSEFMNVHFTDPDNREKVNFETLQKNFQKVASKHLNSAETLDFPSLKSRVTAVLAEIRRKNAHIINSVFPEALEIRGDHSRSVLAFYVHHGTEAIMVIALRKFSEIVSEANYLDASKLQHDRIIIPDGIRGTYIELLSGRTLEISGEFNMSRVVFHLPAAILRRVG